ETILLQLECIGFRTGSNLTHLDELKLAAVVQRTVTPELSEMISGMRSGTEMMRLFESTFRRAGIVQVEALWEKLVGLKYSGGCPVQFVTKFKTAARNFRAAGGESSNTQLMILFKQAVKEKAGRWYGMVSTLARFNEWKFEPLLQDFIATHHEKIGKGTQNSQGEVKGTLGNTQSNGQDQAKNAPSKNQNSKGRGKGKGFRCWNCGKFGHVKTKCPNKKDEAGNKTSFVASKDRDDIGPPPVIADEYCQIKEEQLTSQHFAAQVEPDVYDQVVEYY
ncbi:hypothetical protein K3495_g16416, partial [Podosphaera aphanis]